MYPKRQIWDGLTWRRATWWDLLWNAIFPRPVVWLDERSQFWVWNVGSGRRDEGTCLTELGAKVVAKCEWDARCHRASS